MRFFAAALFFFGAAVSYSQSPEVPHKLQFAGMTLTIKEDARSEIQKDVDALTQHPYYFNMKLERAKTYFPIIEEIFRQERLPEDFKYLALQESALISDAVSSSNAVGFWQFKDFTAEEMGMRVDRDIDERMNLISATRGAARYLKQNNFYFNNWVYALQAYQMGAGGAMRALGDKHNGAKHMNIDKDTYWYVKKYLAHKIAFENALTGEAQLKLLTYETNNKTSLKDIANEYAVQLETLEEYNKWARRGEIPNDKKYTVLIPQGSYDENFTKLAIASPAKPVLIEAQEITIQQQESILINGVAAILARPGDRMTDLADRGGISLSAFLRYNDLSIDHVIITGGTYFIDKKKRRAEEPYHKVVGGENLWSISQSYGIKLKKLKKYNRLAQHDNVSPNEMLWLSKMKPQVENEPVDAATVELDVSEEFNWGISSENNQTSHDFAFEEEPSVLEANTGNVLTGIDEKSDESSLRSSFASQNTQKAYYHEVKASDTLYSVARQYGVTIKDIMAWNHKKDFDLSIGEKLKIVQP